MFLTDILRPKATTLRNPAQWLMDWAGGGKTRSGMRVTPDKAMGLPAVYSAVSFLADVQASLPLQIFTKGPNGTRQKDDGHSLSRLLQTKVNPMMDAFSFRQAMAASAELRGNGYAEIIRGVDGRPRELWFLPAQNMDPKILDNGRLVYLYTDDKGHTVPLRPTDVLHIRALSLNGFIGVSPLSLCRENIGIGLAGEGSAASFYGNGSVPELALLVPGTITTPQIKANKEQWQAAHGGVDNAHKTAVLQGGMTIEKIGVNPDDAQALESRKFSVTDIARMFRVPPHIIGDLEKATFSNIEEQGREVVRYSLAPRLRRWEIEIDIKLLNESDDSYSRHNVDALQRGDTKSRHESHNLALTGGWKNVDEVRALEDMNPLPNGEGQVYRTQMNMAPSGGAPDPEPPPQATVPDTSRIEASFEPLFSAAFGRLRHVENDKIKRAVKRYTVDFGEWVPKFVKTHSGYVRKELLPSVTGRWEAMGRKFDAPAFESAADAYMTAIETYLLTMIEDKIILDSMNDEWASARSESCVSAFGFALRKGDDDGRS